MPPTDLPATTAPTLSDEVVTLRALVGADLEAVVEQSQDPETVRWTFVPRPYSESDGREFIDQTAQAWRDDTGRGWAIEHEGRFAGLIAYQPRGGGAVEVAFAAHPAARGQGVMTRAVRLAAAHAFEHGAAVVLWHARVGNFGSRKVAWRCGFTMGGPVVATRHDQVVEAWTGHLRRGELMEPGGRWLFPPVLESDGLRIRPFRETDGAALPEEHDPLTALFSQNLPTRESYAAWLLGRRTLAATGSSVACAVADAASDELLGGVDLHRLDVPLFAGTGILGYWLLESARGRGAMNRALDLVLPWALEPLAEGGLGLHGLSAGCSVDNVASARVLRRAGFALVGTSRQSMRAEGSLTGATHDELLFDLLATDDREEQRVLPRRLPVVETPRFRLRDWRDADVPSVDEGPDDDSLRFMPRLAHPSHDTYAAWLARHRGFHDAGTGVDWCVADRETDHALGDVTVFDLDPGPEGFQAEIGYWLHPQARGRRVLREVLPVVIDHAFRSPAEGGLGLTRLHAGTVADNAASQSVLRTAGFRRCGDDRQSWRNGNGELTDGVLFELLSTDPRPTER
jgi:RimJ/RimL family protein N-acetyltransferase